MREQVLAVAAEMLARGLTSGTAGNVSGRGAGGEIVLTASGVKDDVVVLDPEGNVVRGHRSPSGEKSLHVAIYAAYPEVRGVVHAHPVYATAFACARQAIPAAVDEFALYVGGDVPCAAYAPSGSDALARNAVGLLADRGAVLLASHGMVAVGTSPADALHVATVVERGAHSIWAAAALGGAVPPPDEANTALAERYLRGRSLPST